MVTSRNRLQWIHATKGAMFAGVGTMDPKVVGAGGFLCPQGPEIATANFGEFLFFSTLSGE